MLVQSILGMRSIACGSGVAKHLVAILSLIPERRPLLASHPPCGVVDRGWTRSILSFMQERNHEPSRITTSVRLSRRRCFISTMASPSFQDMHKRSWPRFYDISEQHARVSGSHPRNPKLPEPPQPCMEMGDVVWPGTVTCGPRQHWQMIDAIVEHAAALSAGKLHPQLPPYSDMESYAGRCMRRG
ncbi:hypothetical protein BKA80DRAFT_263904 [Phyllosticta citrichinensis]